MWIRFGNDKSVWNKKLRETKDKKTKAKTKTQRKKEKKKKKRKKKTKPKRKKKKKQKQKSFWPKRTYFILSEITRVCDCILKC